MSTAVLTAGANTTLSSSELVLTTHWGTGVEVDFSAIVVDTNGRARDEADFIFYNQPVHHSGVASLRPSPPGEARLDVALDRHPVSMDRLLLVASVHSGTFEAVGDVSVSIAERSGAVVARLALQPGPIKAAVLAELYSRNGAWKVRAVGQGYAGGLGELARAHGLDVEESTPPPLVGVDRIEPNWYQDPKAPTTQRWWDGDGWTDNSLPIHLPGSGRCARCGDSTAMSPGGCRRCNDATTILLKQWTPWAERVLEDHGPVGPQWEKVVVHLRRERVAIETGLEAIRPATLRYLRRYVTDAFDDGLIEQHELDGYRERVAALQLPAAAVREMTEQMETGARLTRYQLGQLDRIEVPSLRLAAEEWLHLYVDVTYIRMMASGPRHHAGKLMVTNLGVGFVGEGNGHEYAWGKVQSAVAEGGRVTVMTTSSKGAMVYAAEESDLLAAVATGAMRVSKRIAITPNELDTRRVPQAVRAEVWRRDGGKCVECGSTSYLEYDHVIPWSKGGATSVGNLQLLCRGCNSKKGARI